MALPKPTSALLRECKKMKLKTPMHKVFCDLVVAGWDKEDAYAFSGLWNPTYSTVMNLQDMNHLLKESAINAYMDSKSEKNEAMKKKAKKAAIEAERKEIAEAPDIDMTAELSKDNQLKELLIAKNQHPVGSKEWLDIKKLIADLSRIKQDDIQEEDDVVHFYVPLQCHSCSLYMAQKAKEKKNKQ